MDLGSIVSAASRDLLNPLLPPSRRLERIREILCFMDDLAVTELHNAYRVRRSPLVSDCVFRDPQVPVSENSFDLEAGRLAGMMTAQGLQVSSPEDSLARLGIITNGIILVNIVFRVCIAGGRRLPVRIQGRTDLFLLRGLLQRRIAWTAPASI
jgi:hypothetical protein